MKKKAILFTSAICGVLAIVLFFIGMSVLGWNFTALDSENWVSGSRELNEPPTSIEIVCRDVFLQIETGEQFGVDYEESNKSKVIIEEKDGVLTVKQSHLDEGLFRMFNFHTPTMKLTVPAVLSGLKISVTNGSITVSDMEIAELSVNCTNATVEISDIVSSGDMTVRSTNGSITLDKITTLGELKLTGTNGKMELDDITAEKVDMSSTNGKLKLDGIKCESLKLKTVNGKIEASVTEVKEIVVTSTNGKIILELPGGREDYTVECSSVNGRTPGNSYGGEKKVTCTTTNGNIEISYNA